MTASPTSPVDQPAHRANRNDDRSSADEARGRFVPVAVALTIIVAVAGGLAWPPANRPPARLMPPLIGTPAEASDRFDPFRPPLTATGAVAAATGLTADEQEPGGFDAFPGSRRTAGFVRDHGAWRERTVVREAPATVADEVAAHYEALFTRAGFERVADAERSPFQVTFRRGPADVLSLRVRPTDTATRIVLTRTYRPNATDSTEPHRE